jgi:hypothetical protein
MHLVEGHAVATDVPVGDAAAPARTRVNLRVPPGMDAGRAQDAPAAQLRAAEPCGARVSSYTKAR